MRLARPIVLNPESRRQLERQARGRTVPMRVALRSRIVLLAAEGKQHKQISEELKISPRMAAWEVLGTDSSTPIRNAANPR
jgi:DNA-binding NarL/FixJ family response regulator